ncbi:MAG: hypothetical protein SFY56_16380 [Bacteroidota bacterium]|nr:hypothetical protein [Bacteroidota bacterium]
MSQTLIQLIQFLSRNEKRYINLNLKTFSFDGDSNKFFLDFNFLQKKNTLKNKKNTSLTSGNSTRLYYKILDILFQFHETDLPNYNTSSDSLKRAKLLIYKGLYKEGVKQLDKIIYDSKKFDYLTKMEALELKLNSAIKNVDIEYLKNEYPQEQLLLKKINNEYLNLLEFESLEALIKLESATLYFYGEDHHITQNHLQLLSNENNAYHPLAKIYFNKANAFLSLKRGNQISAYNFANRTIELFNQYPEIKSKNLISFLKSIRNLCIVLMHLKKYKEAGDVLAKIEPSLEIYKKNTATDFKTELFTLFVLLKIDIIIYSNEILEHENKIDFFENEFYLNRDNLRDEEKASFYLNLTILHLALQKHRLALKYTIQALKISGKIRKDIYHLSLFNELVLHHLLENNEVFQSKLNAYKRLVTKKEVMFGFEKELPELLNTIFNNPQSLISYKKLFSKISQSLILEGKEVYKPFISFYYLKAY